MLSQLKVVSIFCLFLSFWNCSQTSVSKGENKAPTVLTDSENQDTIIEDMTDELKPIRTGSEQLEAYLPLIKDKRVGLVVNHTSMVGDKHLVDVLLENGVEVVKIFAPEHGFRGKVDRGATINDSRDEKTGLPVLSIYGKKKKPSAQDLSGIDWMIFDIQDVGARFYTYIYTMHYVMEACAENNKQFLVLDRPNPNGHYVDGPTMKKDYTTFVGLHDGTPVVHGMTIAEYAQMINGEGWLKDGVKCDLSYVSCSEYTHDRSYTLPVKPSPNLPNMTSIYLYPWICYFEGTAFSIGRGTNKQFQVIGHPDNPEGDFYFTPQPMEGARSPKLNGKKCRGIDLSQSDPEIFRSTARLDLKYLIDAYQNFPNKKDFFNANLFFDKLAGSDQLRQQLKAGLSESEIRESWAADLTIFKEKRAKYLIY